jgi:hypothetical protein
LSLIGEPLGSDSQNTRKKIAREAANLLYSGIEKEYKQAKIEAAKIVGVRLLPTNLEVAFELDRLAEEREGLARQERLVRMRRDALGLMQILKAYEPLLIGSVWRGAIHRDSDLDIVVYHDEPEGILKILRQKGVNMTHAEHVAVTKKGKRRGSFHIYVELPSGEKAEIKVSSPEAARKEKCETYGDEIIGLGLPELMKVLEENPTQRFLPCPFA